MPAIETDHLPQAPATEAMLGGDAYWSVDDLPWAQWAPALPDDLIALLAPPVVVGVSRA